MSLQPVCILCLSLCDNSGFLTSCEHFICSRCTKRLQPHNSGSTPFHGGPTVLPVPCPICHKSGVQLLPLTHRSVRPLFHDPAELLQQSSRILTAQLRHYRQTHQRMMDALKVLNTKYQSMERTLKATKRELLDTKETLRTVQQFTQKQSRELDALSKSSSQQQQFPSAPDHTSMERNSRMHSEDPEWVSMLMRGGSCSSNNEGAHPIGSVPQGAARYQPPPRASTSPQTSFGSLGWASTSSVLKRPREGGGEGPLQLTPQSGQRGSPSPSETTPRGGSGGYGRQPPSFTANQSKSSGQDSPVPHRPVQPHSFHSGNFPPMSYSDSTKKNSTPPPLRGLLRSTLMKK